ncbi:SprT family protein [Mergibacter septicus]|uniref:SprT family zinc-dependent metalloprotease n=1 Tax=Mergibacter septicus TaxID=221402 RepID=UPI001C77FB31|nr:SprT family zinc-dependent metalloprotease [Mergibacter septicus]QDJ13298.1 SprT family protein [Mergibacter septicus]
MSELSLASKQQLRHLKRQVQQRLKTCLKIAEQYFQRDFLLPQVSYQVRGLKAGVAYLQQWQIRLNPLLLLENPTDFIQQVVPHELAHLIVYACYGNVRPHGKEWKFVMEQLFHLKSDVYHQFDITNVQGKTFAYSCHCQTHYLSLRRHNRVIRQQAIYHCKQCNSQLQYQAE